MGLIRYMKSPLTINISNSCFRVVHIYRTITIIMYFITYNTIILTIVALFPFLLTLGLHGYIIITSLWKNLNKPFKLLLYFKKYFQKANTTLLFIILAAWYGLRAFWTPFPRSAGQTDIKTLMTNIYIYRDEICIIIPLKIIYQTEVLQ